MKHRRDIKYFKDEKEAVLWRNKKAYDKYGEYAYQNIIKE